MVNPTLPVDLAEAEALLPSIRVFFKPLVNRYDENRYPPSRYAQLKERFSEPRNVERIDIEAALRWEYARPIHRSLPAGQAATMQRLAKRWRFLIEAHGPAEQIEALVDPNACAQDFVSRVFLVHLTSPRDVPMVDRFNHRAVRWLLGTLRKDFPLGGLPRHYGDVELIHSFSQQILEAWGDGAPPLNVLDRYLMMFGKNVTPRYRA